MSQAVRLAYQESLQPAKYFSRTPRKSYNPHRRNKGADKCCRFCSTKLVPSQGERSFHTRYYCSVVCRDEMYKPHACSRCGTWIANRRCENRACFLYVKRQRRRKVMRSKQATTFAQRFPALYDPDLMRELRSQLIEEYGVMCMNCGCTDRVVLDHIKPRWYGGTNEIENLQLLCWPCNFQKGLQTIDYRP
jgi:5-methylcytosine-specific restriction endonuclease McrA